LLNLPILSKLLFVASFAPSPGPPTPLFRKKMPFKAVKQPKCIVCKKTAYVTERFELDGESYHNKCFRCSHCKGHLTMSSYAMIDKKPYCKPHYKELFMSSGGSFDKAFNAGLSKKAKELKAAEAAAPAKKQEPEATPEPQPEPVAEEPVVEAQPEPVVEPEPEPAVEEEEAAAEEEVEPQSEPAAEQEEEPQSEPVAEEPQEEETASEEVAAEETDAAVEELTQTTAKWTVDVDPDTGDKFYTNTETGEPVWEKPVDFDGEE